MTREHTPGRDAAVRLRDALVTPDQLTHDEAEALIPALIEAEQAGKDVDADSTFTALLRHLDSCDACMTLYAEVSASLEALTGADEVLPLERFSPAQPLFRTTRQTESVILRVLSGLQRRFELGLALPRLTPSIPTLGTGQRITLFSDTLEESEVAGAPLVAVTLSASADVSELLVAIREPSGRHWRVQLAQGTMLRETTTDERGVARFTNLSLTDAQELTIGFAEA